MSKITRRRFIEDSALVLAAVAVPGKLLADDTQKAGAAKAVSPNEKVRMAVIGVNGRGMAHVKAYAGMPDVDVVAICDCDTATFTRAVNAVADNDRPEPKTYQDIRKMLEDKDIDAVSIATPNHWHALGAIWAMEAGKDVYLEKPVCHTLWEGRQIVNAARRYNRICQAGTQSRSNPGMIEAIQYIHEGNIGKVRLARGLCYKNRPSIGRAGGPQTPPETVDYDLWTGPRPMKPLIRKRFHYDWHWQSNYGNGDLGNQGAHEMDKARWGLKKTEHPKSCMSLGWRFGYRDDGDTPNTQVTLFDYGDCQLIFEVRGLPTQGLLGAGIGNIWYGEKGYVVAPSYSRATAYDNDGKMIKEFAGSGDHFRNFIDVVKSRKASDLKCEIEDGFMSSALCCLSDVSYYLGDIQPFSETPDLGGNKDMEDSFERLVKHLADNGVSRDHWSIQIGKSLNFDGLTETVPGDDAANAIIRPQWRAPYIVPDLG